MSGKTKSSKVTLADVYAARDRVADDVTPSPMIPLHVEVREGVKVGINSYVSRNVKVQRASSTFSYQHLLDVLKTLSYQCINSDPEQTF